MGEIKTHVYLGKKFVEVFVAEDFINTLNCFTNIADDTTRLSAFVQDYVHRIYEVQNLLGLTPEFLPEKILLTTKQPEGSEIILKIDTGEKQPVTGCVVKICGAIGNQCKCIYVPCMCQ
jgi:cadmium resistance protein CadD (predicted permease)